MVRSGANEPATNCHLDLTGREEEEREEGGEGGREIGRMERSGRNGREEEEEREREGGGVRTRRLKDKCRRDWYERLLFSQKPTKGVWHGQEAEGNSLIRTKGIRQSSGNTCPLRFPQTEGNGT